MNFALLNRIKTPPKQEEFDVKKYIDHRSKMTYQVDSYFVTEPIPLIDSCLLVDNAINIDMIEMESSLISIIEKF